MGMSIIRKMRRQKAVYWGSPQPDGYGGTVVAMPVEIDCRWEDVQELIKTANGEEAMSKSQVYVDRDLDEGGYLWLGELDDLPQDPSNPKANGADEIMKFGKLPTLKVRTDGLDPNANEYLRTAWL